jgi:hypothetical protein
MSISVLDSYKEKYSCTDLFSCSTIQISKKIYRLKRFREKESPYIADYSKKAKCLDFSRFTF